MFLLGLASLALPAVAAAQPAAAAAPASSQAAAVDAVVQKAMQTRQFPAASIAVVKDGTVVLAKGYGLSDVEKSIKATEQTVYQLASVTKPFTAMAILMLVEDGKLSLDGKITEILPGLPAAWAPVTVRHLLSHTSGIKSYTDVFGEKKVAGQPGVHAPSEILALVKDAPLAFTPGEKFAYCNTGYYLLGMIVEKASGKPYADVRRRPYLQAARHDLDVARRLRRRAAGAGQGLQLRRTARPRRRSTPTRRSRSPPARSSRPSSTWRSGTPRSTGRKLLKPASYDADVDGDAPQRRHGVALCARLGGPAVPDPAAPVARRRHQRASRPSSPASPTTRSRSSRSSTRAAAPAGALANGIAEIYVPALKDHAPKPIADPDPTVTAFLKQALTSAAGGTIDPEWLTPEFRSFLLPDRIKQGPDMMGRHGALQAFELMEDTTRDGRRVRIYRATFGTTPVRAQFTLSADGKIAGLGISPAN